MMNGNESKRSGGSPGDAPACVVSVQDPSVLDDSVRGQRALTEDGQRWRAYMNVPMTSSRTSCASCESAGVDQVPSVDPRTARVVEWSVLGDAREFAFVCHDCASALDGYDRMKWIDDQVAVAVTYYEKIPHSGSVRFDACQILGVVTEFAELLRVHYAGGE